MTDDNFSTVTEVNCKFLSFEFPMLYFLKDKGIPATDRESP
jgi:hypothetical protein